MGLLDVARSPFPELLAVGKCLISLGEEPLRVVSARRTLRPSWGATSAMPALLPDFAEDPIRFRPRWGISRVSTLVSPTECGDFVTNFSPPGVVEILTKMSDADVVDDLNVSVVHNLSLLAGLRSRFTMLRVDSERFREQEAEIALLRGQLANVNECVAEAEIKAGNLAKENAQLLLDLSRERSSTELYKSQCSWAMQQLKDALHNQDLALQEFSASVQLKLDLQDKKLHNMSIDFDEELYPHLMSSIAERRWLIRHGLRLAVLNTLESEEVRVAYGAVVDCAIAHGKTVALLDAERDGFLKVAASQCKGYFDNAYDELIGALNELKDMEFPFIGLLERDQDYPIKTIMSGLTLSRHNSDDADQEDDLFLKPDVSQLRVPIFKMGRGVLDPFSLQEEVSLKEVLEKHAARVARKKGVKGKAVISDVGAAHLPRSDGVPVSVATVAPQNVLALRFIKNASRSSSGDSSSLRRTNSCRF